MKMSELKQLSSTELSARLFACRQEYYSYQEEVLASKEKNYRKLGLLRRDIARLQTALRDARVSN